MARALEGLGIVLLCACATTGPDRARAQAYYDEGDRFYSDREFLKAIQSYTVSLQANPESPDPYFKRGKSRIKLIDQDPRTSYLQATEEAVEDFDRAIRLYPEFFEAYYARAVANASRARYKDAAFDLLHYCLKIRPEDKDSTLALARVYDTGFEGKQVEALRYYTKYLQLGGTDSKARARHDELKAGIVTLLPADEDEKKASDLFQKAMKAVGEGKRDEGLKALNDLKARHAKTKFVKDQQAMIDRLASELEPKKDKK